MQTLYLISGLVSQIYKELLKLDSKTQITMKNMNKDLNRHFSKGDIQMDNMHIKRYSTSQTIMEMQNQNEILAITSLTFKESYYKKDKRSILVRI